MVGRNKQEKYPKTGPSGCLPDNSGQLPFDFQSTFDRLLVDFRSSSCRLLVECQGQNTHQCDYQTS